MTAGADPKFSRGSLLRAHAKGKSGPEPPAGSRGREPGRGQRV